METGGQQPIIFWKGAIPASCITELIQSHQLKKNLGAYSIFSGQVRADVVEGATVSSIYYTAYEQMALEKMQEISKMIYEKYSVDNMTVYHSLGDVAVGEICLCVFTASPHRKAAIEACDEIIEKVKNELPIWGKEYFEESGHRWKINKE